MLDEVGETAAKRALWWRRIVGVTGMLVLLGCAFRVVARPLDGDFKLHWEFGRRFLAGEFLYTGGMHLPYPPFWAMAHAPAALLPLPVAKALLFLVGVAALLLLLRLLRSLAGHAFDLDRTRSFWVAALALVLAGRYVIRDMAELGVNTLLVTLTWLAIYLWTQRRDLLGGVSLGLAVALKCTPAIFVGYFLWKRQWKMFASSCVAALLFTVAPILWQGPAVFRQHMTTWVGNAWRGFGSTDPSIGVLGPEPVQNMALRPVLARYLMRLPADHPGRVPHRFYAESFDLSPAVANGVIKVVLLGLLAFFLWWSRAAVVSRQESGLLWEFAALGVLMLLLSPITWGQHCVAALPACYLVSVLYLSRGLPRWMLVVLGFWILFVAVLSRDVLGRELALLFASYHFGTFALLGLWLITMASRRLARDDQARRAGLP